MTINQPIIISEGLDLSFYDSTENAELALEGPDVLDGIFEAFDSKGHVLELRSEGGPHDYSARVRIEERQGETAPDKLIDILLRYLEAIGVEPPKQRSLDTLVACAIRQEHKT